MSEPGTAPPESAVALPPGTRMHEFVLERVLGVGGFGIVYLARDELLERAVAIKEYLPAAISGRSDTLHVTLRTQSDQELFSLGLRSFVNEARLLARFDHPSLIKVYRFWESHGTAYMAMPLLQGDNLRDLRKRQPLWPEARLRRLLDDLLGALAQLHAAGVYHRDIAPDNIVVEPDGRPVLLDFGAARRVIGDKSQLLTAILKPAYAPIEQYGESAALKQGPWTDLYALGATLHFLLLGRPPEPSTVRVMQAEAEPLFDGGVPGVSRALLDVVAWMLAPRPAQRPASVQALREVLDGTEPCPWRCAGPAGAEADADVTIVLPRPGADAPAFAPTIRQTRPADAPEPGDRPVAPDPGDRPAAAAGAGAGAGPAAGGQAVATAAARGDGAAPRAAGAPLPAPARAGRRPAWLMLAAAGLAAVAAGGWWAGSAGPQPTPPAAASAAPADSAAAAAPAEAGGLVLPGPDGAIAPSAPARLAAAAAHPGRLAGTGPAGGSTGAPRPQADLPTSADPGPGRPARAERPEPGRPGAQAPAATARPASAAVADGPPAAPSATAGRTDGPHPSTVTALPAGQTAPAAVPVAAAPASATGQANPIATPPTPGLTPAPASGARPILPAPARDDGPAARCADKAWPLNLVCMEDQCLRSRNRGHADCIAWRNQSRPKDEP